MNRLLAVAIAFFCFSAHANEKKSYKVENKGVSYRLGIGSEWKQEIDTERMRGFRRGDRAEFVVAVLPYAEGRPAIGALDIYPGVEWSQTQGGFMKVAKGPDTSGRIGMLVLARDSQAWIYMMVGNMQAGEVEQFLVRDIKLEPIMPSTNRSPGSQIVTALHSRIYGKVIKFRYGATSAETVRLCRDGTAISERISRIHMEDSAKTISGNYYGDTSALGRWYVVANSDENGRPSIVLVTEGKELQFTLTATSVDVVSTQETIYRIKNEGSVAAVDIGTADSGC